jgi:hypothetical protein
MIDITSGGTEMNYTAIFTVILMILTMAMQGCATPARQAAVPMGLED